MGSIIFIDTSAFVAILAIEPERERFYRELASATRRMTSACVRLETSMVLSARLDMSPTLAETRFDLLVRSSLVEEIPISPTVGTIAVQAFLRYGKGRHPARLNLADCLSYACAKAHGARLLFKGDDFVQTDVNEIA